MSVVQYQLEGSVALVRMDDGKANALSEAMLAQLDEALTRAEKEATALVLAGRAERFCAGFDLRMMMASPDAAKTLVRAGAALLMRVYGTPLPVVAACTGHALAAGALLLLASDLRIGAGGAYRIGLNEVAIGLPVPTLAMELARDRIAPDRLTAATLHGRICGPEEAVQVGFLDEVTPAAEVLARATAQAQGLGALSRLAYQGTKQRLRGRTIRFVLDTLDEDMRAIGG
jgi:enoyl-CoA hydratase/carnithine racemase